VFASTQFPPGSYKTLVTVATEQSIYENAFRSNAADAIVREYDAAEASSDATAAIAMSAKALATTDEILDFDVREWFERESGRLARQYAIEDEILAAVASAASAKMEAARTSTRTSFALSSFVLLASALLAWTIGRGVIRTVIALSSAAALVRRTKDYSIRAPKTSADELGALTDAFNEMLSDIQGRDKELQVHRDNLESTVASRTAELVSRTAAMRLVLDNVDQGLATIRRDGKLDSERSAAFDRLFGRPVDGIGFAEHLGAADETLAQRLKIGWEQVVDAWLPIEVAIEQLPQHIVCEGTHVTLGYRPIQRDGLLDGVLLVASDVTAEHAAREGQERQREYIATFERITRDRDGFVEFFTEIARLLKRLADGSADPIERMRIAHTIKGNAAQWGVSSVAKIAHELESKLVAGDGATEHDFQQLFDTWEAVRIRYTPLLGDEGVRLTITSAEMDGVLSEIQARVPHDELLRRIERLRHEPTGTRFERMAADLHRLADRLNKPMPKVVVDANDVRLPASRFSPFWQATVHVLRNIMDHGIETAEERAAAGKPEAGTVTLRSVATGDQFRIEFSDDGRGIDWGKIASKALEAGLPAERHADLERALFAPGISTAAAVTDLSGRGVGLSSVEACCKALGGFATVTSELGKGTRFSFVFPRKPNENSIRPEARSLN
jgi:two-component system chemotaxis sensor kinase CheA